MAPYPRTTARHRAIAALLTTVCLIWALPLAGVAASGQRVSEFLAFPPRTEHVVHASFSWAAFFLMSLPVVAAIALYVWALARARPEPAVAAGRKRFPWWVWLGVALVAAAWFLAWSDVLPPPWRRHTFTPLWIGYVVSMNALAYRRSGRSLLTHEAGWFVALFPLSAVFWWKFEYLNQFADNWYYTGLADERAWSYFLQATLPFSTVLPAVASTWAWLKTFPRLNALSLPPLSGHPALAWLALAAGALLLGGLGVWPESLFSMLWITPLLVLAGLQRLLLGETLFAPLRHGDWRPVLQPALAALICGFFWEMWNAGSLTQWHYSIPYVQRFHIFEMPLLGYAGYLPFGIECALVMDVAAKLRKKKY